MSIEVEVIVTTKIGAGEWKGHFYSTEHDETGVTLDGAASLHGYNWLSVKMAVDDTRSSMEYVKSATYCDCVCCTTRRREELAKP